MDANQERDLQRELATLRSDMRDAMSRLENIQRAADRLHATMQTLDIDQRFTHLLDTFSKHSEATLRHLDKIDQRRAEERGESTKILTKALAELWNKGGQYLVLGFSILLVGAIAKWAGLPVPFFGSLGP